MAGLHPISAILDPPGGPPPLAALEPLPAGVRWRPPLLPPAPPGSGEAPWPSEPPRARGFTLRLTELAASVLVSGAVLAALEVQVGPAAEGPMDRLVAEHRPKIRQCLEALRASILPGQTRFQGTDLADFQSTLLDFAQQGIPSEQLDSVIGRLFHERLTGEQTPRPVYRYEFGPRLSLADMTLLYPWEFADRVLEDLLEAVDDDETFSSLDLLNRRLIHRVLALLWASGP